MYTFFLQSVATGLQTKYKLRLREGLRSFVEEVSKLATLHVYTMGSKSYTREVLLRIDPAHLYLPSKAGPDGSGKGQVFCRSDSEENHFSKSLTHFLDPAAAAAAGGELTAEEQQRLATMLILDDREDAWDPASRPAVLQCIPYRCWTENAAPIPLPAAADTCLLDMLETIRGVASDLQAGTHASVADSLQARRLRVLDGVVLVFSGGILRDDRQPERCTAFRTAQAFGARVELRLDYQRVTHVVTGNPDSSTVRKTLGVPGIHIVSLQWLLDSTARWHRQHEDLYSFRPGVAAAVVGRLGPDRPLLPARPAAAAAAGGGGGAQEVPASARPTDLEATKSAIRLACSLVCAAEAGDAAPADASPAAVSQRVRAIVLYLAPAELKQRATALLNEFNELGEDDERHARKQQVLSELTEVVGGQQVMLMVLKGATGAPLS